MEHAIIPDDRSVTFINDFGADANLAIARLLGYQKLQDPRVLFSLTPAQLKEQRQIRAASLEKEIREQEAMYGLL